MAFDIQNNYFLIRIEDCAKYLSQEELDILQGLIKKVEINCPRPSEYLIISKGDKPKLFNTIKKLLEEFYGIKKTKDAEGKE